MSGANERSMTQTDLMSWRMEADPVLRSTIVSIIVLDRLPDHERLTAAMNHAIDVVPIFRCKAVARQFPWSPPRWVDDADFDLSWHLRRSSVPPPGGWKGVLDFARMSGMAAFDKDRPLWELTVLDGLGGGATALVVKVHHSLTDGVGGMQLTREITDDTRTGGSSQDGHEFRPPVVRSTPGDSRAAMTEAVARSAAHAVRHPAATMHDVVRIFGSTARMTRPATRTMSPVMTARSTRRGFGVIEFPVAALTTAAAGTQCSVNDAFLSALLLGMAGYHRGHGDVPNQLMVTLPISLRDSRDPLGGNRITLARFALPVDIADPEKLIRRVHAIVESWRNEPAIPLSPHLARMLNLLPVAVTCDMLKHMDFVASNVVGSSTPLYLAGARIIRQFAFSPTLGSAFNATLMSYDSHMCVGINVAVRAVPDQPALMTAVAEGFRAVLALGSRHTDATVTTSY